MTIGRQYQSPYEVDADGRQDQEPGSPATVIEASDARDPDLLDERDAVLVDEQRDDERLDDERDADVLDERDAVLVDEQRDDERDADVLDERDAVLVDEQRDDERLDDERDADVLDALLVDEQQDDEAAALEVATYVPETPAGTHALSAEWQSLQGRFVDDPDAAVGEAAALVDEAIQRLLESLRDGTSEQVGDVSTEQKRLAFQRYRAVYEVLSST